MVTKYVGKLLSINKSKVTTIAKHFPLSTFNDIEREEFTIPIVQM